MLTFRERNRGTNEQYIHAPRQPSHHLPAKYGDQLCHAVLRPRAIRPMKASKYSNTYQMHQQRGSFQGIDTCDIQMFGRFDFTSRLLDQSESLSISNHVDINALLEAHCRDGIISKLSVETRQQ